MLTEEEKKAFLKNEERLWDLAAITAAPTLYQHYCDKFVVNLYEVVAISSYDVADALILERRKRLKS